MDDDAIAALLADAGRIEEMPEYAGFDPGAERGVEAVFAVANGILGVRAALEEGNPASRPLLIIAGAFVPTPSEAQQTLLALPDPAVVQVRLDGIPLQFDAIETFEHRRVVDLDRALLLRWWRFTDAAGRLWSWRSVRAASLAEGRAYLHGLTLQLERAPDACEVRLDIAGEPDAPVAEGDALSLREARDHGVATVAIRRRVAGPRLARVAGGVSARLAEGEGVSLESVTSVRSAANPAGADDAAPFAASIAAHVALARERRRVARIAAEGRPDIESAVELAVHHLLSSAAPVRGATSVGARDLSGEGYHGHIFWDTEIFALPALTLLEPGAARSCLAYRYRTLDEARRRAASLGYRGALFAWESTDTGADRTPASARLPDGSVVRIRTGEQEHHIAADVAYAVMRYWEATGDDAFMREQGAEIVFECARFWASRVAPDRDRFAIHGVIGADEFHTGVDNDAFTNAMAAKNLRDAAALAAWLGEGAQPPAGAAHAREGASPGEAGEWSAMAARIVRSSFLEDAVVEQFDGFFALAPVDVAAYRDAGVPIDLALGPAAIEKARVIKQADVVMAAALLPDTWSEAALRTNFAYYAPLTSHVSSLSAPIYAVVAAWLRDAVSLESALGRAIRTDFGNGYTGASGGIHMATCGGLWQCAVFGLAGLRYSAEGVAFDPYFPERMHRLAFAVRWRGRVLRVSVVARSLEIAVEGEAVPVRVNGVRRDVREGAPARFEWDPAYTYWSRQGG